MMRILGVLATVWLLLGAAAHAETGVVRVHLEVDLDRGRAMGRAEYPDGQIRPIAIERPALADAEQPLDGYIGPDSALLPTDAGWLPPLPKNGGSWRIDVTTPPGVLAAPYPAGDIVYDGEGRAHARFVLTPLTARAPLVVGRFELTERRFGDIVLRTFFTEPNAGEAPGYLAAAEAAIGALSARIGPYPYGAFAIVESPLPVGLGYPGFTLVSGRILPLPFMRGRSLWHEIAHVWWGNGAFVDYETGNWAEGFATFFADYALAERRGPAAAREMRYDWLLEFDALPQAQDRPLREFVAKSHGQAQAIGYGKAAMLLYMLREKIGVAAFDAGIRRFWKRARGRTVGWREFAAAMDPGVGEPLYYFFALWLELPGAALADPADKDFDVFRRLAPEERILTLRAVLSADRFRVRPLDGAPGDAAALAAALAPLGDFGAGGVPVYVGTIAALKQRLRPAPTEASAAAIWAATDGDGAPVLAIAAPDMDDLAGLARRARHFQRWSWLTVGADGQSARGRWPPGAAVSP